MPDQEMQPIKQHIAFTVSSEVEGKEATEKHLKVVDKFLKKLQPTIDRTRKEWGKWSTTISDRFATSLNRTSKATARFTKNLTKTSRAYGQVEKSARQTGQQIRKSGLMASAASAGMTRLALGAGAAFLALKGLRGAYEPRIDVGVRSGVDALNELRREADRAGISMKHVSSLFSSWQSTSARAQFGAIPEARRALPQLQGETRGLGTETSSRLITDLVSTLDPSRQQKYFADVLSKGVARATRDVASANNIQQASALLNAVKMSTMSKQGTLPKHLQAAIEIQRAQEKIGQNLEAMSTAVVEIIAPAVSKLAGYTGKTQLGIAAGGYGAYRLGRMVVPKILGRGGATAARAAIGVAGAAAPSAVPYSGALGALTPAAATGGAAAGGGLAAAGAAPIAATVGAGAVIGTGLGLLTNKYLVRPLQDWLWGRSQREADQKHMEGLKKVLGKAEKRKAKELGITPEQWRKKRVERRAEMATGTTTGSTKIDESLKRMAETQEKLTEQYHLRQANLSIAREQIETERMLHGHGAKGQETYNRLIADQMKLLKDRLQIERTDTTIQGRLKVKGTEASITQLLREQRMLRASMPREKFGAKMSLLDARLQAKQSRLDLMRNSIWKFASTGQYVRVYKQMTRNLETMRAEHERLSNVQNKTHGQKLDQLNLETRINQSLAQRNEIYRSHAKGTLQAVQASAVGQGKFEKILVTQQQNLDKSLRRGMVRSTPYLGISGSAAAAAESSVKPFQFGDSMPDNLRGLTKYSQDLQKQWMRNNQNETRMPILPILPISRKHLNVSLEKAGSLPGAVQQAGKALEATGKFLQGYVVDQANRIEQNQNGMYPDQKAFSNAGSFSL